MTNDEKERLKEMLRESFSVPTEDADFLCGLIDRVPSEEEAVLRRLLWLHHGCPTISLYGDDGEMQCSKCGIDFKRMGAKDIERFWMSEQYKAIRKAFGLEEG